MEDVRLIPVDLSRDIHMLFNYMSADDQYLFSTRVLFNTEALFGEWLVNQLHREFHDFYIVEIGDKKIGFVHNYDFSLVNGHCKLVVYIDKVYRELGIGGISAIKFIKKLFNYYPLRKIYITIYDYNKESLQSNLKAGFVEEGHLKEYRYFSGKYYGLYYLSMTRKVFEDSLGKLVD